MALKMGMRFCCQYSNYRSIRRGRNPADRSPACCTWRNTTRVPTIRTTETVNCSTTNTLRGILAKRPTLKVPFNTLTGWKEDSKCVITTSNQSCDQRNSEAHHPKHRNGKGKLYAFSGHFIEEWQHDRYECKSAVTKAKPTTSNDSIKNLPISCPFHGADGLADTDFLCPLFERAVLRFMKLMQASSNTNIPMIPKSQTYSMRPPVFIPFLNSWYKCQRPIGWRKMTRLGFGALLVEVF